MMGKYRKIISYLFLLVFLLPSLVRIEHHHKDSAAENRSEKSYPVLKRNCTICNFEYSFFLTSIENIDLPDENPLDRYCNWYNSIYNNNLAQYSFLLRAPPEEQIYYSAS